MATSAGFGLASLDAEDGAAASSDVLVSLTEELGCTELRVDGYRLTERNATDLRPGRERVVVPLDGAGPVLLDGRYEIPTGGIGRLAPDRPCTLGAAGDVDALVVSATADADATEPRILDVETAEYVMPSTSDVVTAHLTVPLGCTGMKVNARVLEPGQAVPPHTEGRQEELFVPLDESASMRVGDDRLSTPTGTVVRVAPDTVRSACNGGSTDARWLMFGAPPTGGPSEWDPGAAIVE